MAFEKSSFMVEYNGLLVEVRICMDDFDKKILAALQTNARLTLTELSGTINLSIKCVKTKR
jgi:hypothetical protein